jgi:hypothetical protein
MHTSERSHRWYPLAWHELGLVAPNKPLQATRETRAPERRRS